MLLSLPLQSVYGGPEHQVRVSLFRRTHGWHIARQVPIYLVPVNPAKELHWYRLWAELIKLLRAQISYTSSSSSSPGQRKREEADKKKQQQEEEEGDLASSPPGQDEFVSDAFGDSGLSEEEIRREMEQQMLGGASSDKNDELQDWKKDLEEKLLEQQGTPFIFSCLYFLLLYLTNASLILLGLSLTRPKCVHSHLSVPLFCR
ncbi:hypothetical protein RRG08_033635 [Elysia crispata]|uniref:Uncharacterized protein n=1 Tax=Elysia crispata TaxID=231223 RepID=A0AAE1CKG5_9GAST|nr:hypothetical protein RRG08_033635 [Elysia crispata]